MFCFFGNAFDNCNSFELGVHAGKVQLWHSQQMYVFLGSSIFLQGFEHLLLIRCCVPPSHDLLPAAVSTSLQLVLSYFLQSRSSSSGTC